MVDRHARMLDQQILERRRLEGRHRPGRREAGRRRHEPRLLHSRPRPRPRRRGPPLYRTPPHHGLLVLVLHFILINYKPVVLFDLMQSLLRMRRRGVLGGGGVRRAWRCVGLIIVIGSGGGSSSTASQKVASKVCEHPLADNDVEFKQLLWLQELLSFFSIHKIIQ